MITINPTKEKFVTWHDKFVKRKVFGLGDIYDNINNNHKEIRKLIGGVEKIYEVNTEGGKVPLDYSEIESYVDQILTYLPEYLTEYKLDRSIFLEEKVGKVKLNKHVMTYANKKYGDKKNDIWSYARSIEYYLNHIANIKKENLIEDGNLFVKISTVAEAFIMLGHYGPDNDSCFGNGRQNYQHKYRLANRKNTFVVLVSEDEKFTKIIARCWGFLSDGKVLNFCNSYIKKLNQASIKAVLKEVCKQIYKKKDISCKEDIAYVEDGVYLNEDFMLTCGPSSKDLDRFEFKLDKEDPEPFEEAEDVW